MPRKKAYSYIRFSSKQQAKGKSLKRQIEETRKYCELNDLDLDETITYQDLGVSAFKGKNLEQGQLGKFIQACDDGLIAKGSAFVLENLDRLSRQRPRKVVALLDTLLSDYGLEVHLTQANKVFKPDAESAGEEGMDLIFAVAMAIRAAEEQETKSIRLKHAFAKQRQEVAEGKKKILHNRKCNLPWWIEYDEEKNKLFSPPEKAAVVVEAFELVANGASSQQVATEFNARKIPTWRPKTKIWVAARVRDLIRRDEALGVLSATPKTIKAGINYRIENYYPKLVDKKLAAKARETFEKNNKKGKGRNATGLRPINVLKGLIRVNGQYCSYQLSKNKVNGVLNGYYTGLKETEVGKRSVGSTSSQIIESTLLLVLNELEGKHLMANNVVDQVDSHKKLVMRYRERLEEGQKAVNQITKAIEVGGNLEALVNRLATLEKNNAQVAKELKEVELNAPSPVRQQSLQLTLDEVRKLPLDRLNDNSVREVLKNAFSSLVERIDVTRTITEQHKGFILHAMTNSQECSLIDDPNTRTRQKYDMAAEIHFKAGGKRVFLRLHDAKYGEFNGKIVTAKNF